MPHDAGVRIDPAADLIRQRHIMVVVDGLHAGNARQHALAAPAETAVNMGRKPSGQDHLVRRGHLSVDPHRRPPFGCPQVHAGFRGRIVVVHLNATEQLCADDFFFFRIRIQPVFSGGDHNTDILIRNAKPIQFFHQDWQEQVKTGPGPGNVADDQEYLVPCLHQLVQRRRADRMGQRLFHQFFHRTGFFCHRRQQYLRNMCFRKNNDLFSLSVRNSVFHVVNFLS